MVCVPDPYWITSAAPRQGGSAARPGKTVSVPIAEDRGGDQREYERRQSLAPPLRSGGARPHGQERPQQHFPHARRQQVERRRRRPIGPRPRRGPATAARRPRSLQGQRRFITCAAFSSMNTGKTRCRPGPRPTDSARPAVKQRLQRRRRIEIPDLEPEIDVRRRERRGDAALPELLQVVGHEEERRGDGAEQKHLGQRRQQLSGAARVEINDRIPPGGQLLRQDRGDQVAGNDKEDVDPDEPAGEPVRMPA